MPKLSALSELIPHLSSTAPSMNEINQIYALFERHFIHEGVEIDGAKLNIYTRASCVPMFRGKAETFVHIVTRKGSDGLRYFDAQRANRVHWIKPILLDVQDNRVYVFDKAHHRTGDLQRYFWYKDKSFVVILRHTHATHYLLTAFCVEKLKEKQFLSWYEQNPCNKKPHIMCGARNLGIATE